MASPQTEDGHVEIANDLWEALMAAGLNKNEYRALLCILRYSYGVKQKYAKLRKIEMSRLTRIPLQKVNETLTTLENKNIIRIGQNNGYIYFHKDYEKWQLNERLTFDEKWKAQVHETLTRNLTKREVELNESLTSTSKKSTSKQGSRSSKESKESLKKRMMIRSQISKLILQFPDNLKMLIDDYIENARMENKTREITLNKHQRLLNELWGVWSDCAIEIVKADFKTALRVTVNKQVPNINYLKKVMKNIANKRALRMKEHINGHT